MKWSISRVKPPRTAVSRSIGQGCPLLLTRPLPVTFPIALVKSAFLFRRKEGCPTGQGERPAIALPASINVI